MPPVQEIQKHGSMQDVKLSSLPDVFKKSESAQQNAETKTSKKRNYKDKEQLCVIRTLT